MAKIDKLNRYRQAAWRRVQKQYRACYVVWGKGQRTVQKHYRICYPVVLDRARVYAMLMRLHHPIGLFLLGWPTLWALFLSVPGLPEIDILIIFILGVVCMRSAGCVINDYADREIDGQVARTCKRPIPLGKVTEKEALIVFVVLLLFAGLLVLQLNPLSQYLSFGALVLATIYPFTKRFIYLPQAFLGIAFAWAIPMAWAAQTAEVPPVSWLLFIIVILWVMAYDTLYAMVDREDDLRIGVKSSAILFGDTDRLMIGLLQLATGLGLVLLGGQTAMGWPYYLGLVIAAVLMGYQQYLIRDRHPKACMQAFLNNNLLGAVIFFGIMLSKLLNPVQATTSVL